MATIRPAAWGSSRRPKHANAAAARRSRSAGSALSAPIVGTATGTPEYMAPEQFAGGEQLDYARCDIYAVGTMMYRMLTGEPPFKGANEFVLRDAKMFEDPVPPSRLNGDIPGRMDKLILKAIDKDPARRFASALEMRDELLTIDGGAGSGRSGRAGCPMRGFSAASLPVSGCPNAPIDPAMSGRRRSAAGKPSAGPAWMKS